MRAGASTSDVAAGSEHRDLVAYLYQNLPTDHPILTLTSLYRLCDEVQDRVSDQISQAV